MNKHKTLKLYIAIIFLTLYPSVAYAYIDPGIFSVMIQTVFALLMGFITAWIITPWSTLKSFFRKLVGKEKPKAAKQDNVRNNQDNIQPPD